MNTLRKAPVVSVINMKGGVGKTLISANLFREVFRRRKKRILLIDFDTQYNLTQLLLTSAEYEHLKNQRKTIHHVVEPPQPLSVFHVNEDAMLDIGNVDDYTMTLYTTATTPPVELRLLAGDFKMSRLNIREKERSLRLPRKRFESFVAKARLEYDLVVLDCNPSTSFMTRTALEISTHLLVPIRPDKYSVLGAEMLQDFIKELPTVDNPLSILVFNGTSASPSSQEAELIGQLRGHSTFGPNTLVSMIPDSGVLKARSDFTGFALERRAPYTSVIEAKLTQVADELARRLGI